MVYIIWSSPKLLLGQTGSCVPNRGQQLLLLCGIPEMGTDVFRLTFLIQWVWEQLERVGGRKIQEGGGWEGSHGRPVTRETIESNVEVNSPISCRFRAKKHVRGQSPLHFFQKEESQAWWFSQDLDKIVLPEEVRGCLLTIPPIAKPGYRGGSNRVQDKLWSEIHSLPCPPNLSHV